MVLTSDVEPFATGRSSWRRVQLIRKLPSLSGTSPQGTSRLEASSLRRGSPRDWTVLGDGLLEPGLLEFGPDGRR